MLRNHSLCDNLFCRHFMKLDLSFLYMSCYVESRFHQKLNSTDSFHCKPPVLDRVGVRKFLLSLAPLLQSGFSPSSHVRKLFLCSVSTTVYAWRRHLALLSQLPRYAHTLTLHNNQTTPAPSL